MNREEYEQQWAKYWECVTALVDAVHEQLPKEPPKWDDVRLLLYASNLAQLEINIDGLFDLMKEIQECGEED